MPQACDAPMSAYTLNSSSRALGANLNYTGIFVSAGVICSSAVGSVARIRYS